MKNVVLAAVFSASLFAAGAASASTKDQINQCAAELDARGVASANDYRAKFKGVRGGGTKHVTLKMVANEKGKEDMIATCKIKRGEVIDVSVKA
ncbi:MAG: hypothetical protein AAGJ87_08160 [Pseudomonadota bacterium]